MSFPDVLLITPSSGLGGGIERYSGGLEAAFKELGVTYHRFDLHDTHSLGRFSAHKQLTQRMARHLDENRSATRIVAVHRSLLPAAVVMARRRPWVLGTSVIHHGIDVWGGWGVRPERILLRHPRVRVVAVSSFTAGALGVGSSATILAPGIDRGWFETLLKASRVRRQSNSTPRVVTCFRLSAWRGKGLDALVHALELLDRTVELLVVGSGSPPEDLREFLRTRPWIGLRVAAGDQELAELLASSDLMVLATRTRGGRQPSGEGFGYVVLEAMLAGTAVVAPAFGGSHDIFRQGLTGWSPVDESPEALARLMRPLLENDDLRNRVAAAGQTAARFEYNPEVYARQVASRLL